MKRCVKSWVLFSVELIFMLAVPCVIIWLQTGGLNQGYKFSITGIISAMMVFLLLKKILFNNYLKKFQDKISQIEINALTVTDKTGMTALKNKFRLYSFCEILINSVVPLGIAAVFALIIKAVQQGLVELYGCLMLSYLSVGIGVVFKIFEIYSMRCYHEN